MVDDDLVMKIERLRWEAEDEVRPVIRRLESAVQALQSYTALLEQEIDGHATPTQEKNTRD